MAFISKAQGDTIEASELGILKTTNVRSFFFTWSFDEVHRLLENETMTSEVISVDPENDWKVYIQIINGFVSIGLQLFRSSVAGPQDKVTVKYQINLLNRDGRNVGIAGPECTREFTVRHFGISTDFILRNVLINPQYRFLTHGRTLNVHCRISTLHEVQHEVQPVPEIDNNNATNSNNVEAENQQTLRLKSFLLNGTFADLQIISKTNRFPVSKIILAAKSPVFLAMFGTSMTESEENAVNIEEFSDATVSQFLDFIYTGKTEISEENVSELLKIGDKYEVMDLKEKCEQVLLEKIDVQNAIDILILAHFHNPTTLKPKVMEFVNRHKHQILRSEAFNELQAYPELLVELCRALSL